MRHMKDASTVRILMTGSSGHIGRALCPFLAEHGFHIRGFDIRPCGNVTDFVQGNLEDLASFRKAASGMDVLIHLAACSDDADFVTRLVPANVIGAYNAFEAARLENVGRVILASSCQAADLVGRRPKITVEDRFPTDHYGLTKLWAEDMGRMYSHTYGMSILAARLGWVIRSEWEWIEMLSLAGGQELFLSHHDLRRFFLCCLKAAFTPFDVVYAFSQQIRGDIFDMQPSQALIGFEAECFFPNGLDRSLFSQEGTSTDKLMDGGADEASRGYTKGGEVTSSH